MNNRAAKLLTALATLFSVATVHADDTAACGSPPPLQDESLKGSIDGKAELLLKSVGAASLRGDIEISRKEILSKYPNADRTLVNNRYFYTACYILMKSKKSDDEKLKGLRELRREILGASSYADGRRLADQRSVYSFIKQTASGSTRARAGEVMASCRSGRHDYETSRFELTSENLRQRREEKIRSDECDRSSDFVEVRTVTTISANPRDLLPAPILVGFDGRPGPALFGQRMMPFDVRAITFPCQVGRCVAITQQQTGDIDRLRLPAAQNTDITEFRIDVQSPTGTPEFKAFLRALVRLLANGNDEELCSKYIDACA